MMVAISKPGIHSNEQTGWAASYTMYAAICGSCTNSSACSGKATTAGTYFEMRDQAAFKSRRWYDSWGADFATTIAIQYCGYTPFLISGCCEF